MPRVKNQTMKIVRILDLLKLARGRENALTRNQLIEILRQEDVSCVPRTLSENIDELCEYINNSPFYDFMILSEQSQKDHNAIFFYTELKPEKAKTRFNPEDMINLVNGVKALEMTEYIDSEKSKSLCEKIIAIAPEENKKRLTEYAEDDSFLLDTVDAKVLIDAINSLSFLRKESAHSLIDTIIKLSHTEDREALKAEEAKRTDTNNPDNGISVYELNNITEAVSTGKKLSFKYIRHLEFNEKGEPVKVYKYDGQFKTVEPLSMKIESDNYYLTCYDESTEDHEKTYRIDKMDSVQFPSEEDISDAAKEHKTRNQHKGHKFSMFSGPDVDITFIFEEKVIRYINQEFGNDIRIEHLGDNMYKTTACVQVSPPFFGWLFQFGESIRIEAPDDIIKDYCDRLQKVKKMYK